MTSVRDARAAEARRKLLSIWVGIKYVIDKDGNNWAAKYMPTGWKGQFTSEAEALAARNMQCLKHGRAVNVRRHEVQCAICDDFTHYTTVACPAIAMLRALASKEQVLSVCKRIKSLR